MTTAIIGTGGLGSVIARQLASGGQTLRISSADNESARTLAFGTMSAELFESAGNRSPEPAVLFYATGDDRAGEEAERLIRTAGFAPVKAGGLEQSGRLEVGGDLHDLVVGPADVRSLIGRAG